MDSSNSDEEELQHFSAYSKFDESIDVRNSEEVNSPVRSKPLTMMKSVKIMSNDEPDDLDINSPRGKSNFRRFSDHENSFEKPIQLGDDQSDSEETDDDDIQGTTVKKQVELYNPKDFEDLEATLEMKELFQNIMRYTPQKIELNYKLAPYIPDFIPAVGDIDAFIKVPRPDGVADKVGLVVLDEPCANQSEPAVLHLQLRSQSKSADSRKQAVIKRIDNAEKDPKSIDKWIEDMNQLHRSKHPPAVRMSSPMPDIDLLMQQWPPEVEDKLNEAQLDLSNLDCDLPQLVDIVCNLLDIAIKPDARIESLHTLFTLYLEVRDLSDRPF